MRVGMTAAAPGGSGGMVRAGAWAAIAMNKSRTWEVGRMQGKSGGRRFLGLGRRGRPCGRLTMMLVVMGE